MLEEIEKNEGSMFFDTEPLKNKITELFEEQRQIELNKQGWLFDIENYNPSNSTLTYRKDFEQVPLFSGNQIGGIMRRLVMADYLKVIGVDTLYDFSYHILFTGGSLTSKVDGELSKKLDDFQKNVMDKHLKNISATNADLPKMDELTYYCSPLRLLGSATNSGMIESEIIINNARLKCAENGNDYVTLWSLIEDVFLTRADSSKMERDIDIIEASNETRQMKYYIETLIEGTQFEHSFTLRSDNEILKNTFFAALNLFAKFHKIGGKSARGFGDVDLSELEQQIDYDAVQKYYQHLEENKEKIKDWLGVTSC